jgi:hypothetical protein
MLKHSQQRTLDIFCSSYDPEMSFKEVCNEIESEDPDTVSLWDGLSCMRGYDISTLIHEVEEAISEAMKMGK